MENVPMNRGKHLAYILNSNWIHLLGIYLCVEAMIISLPLYQLFRTHEWSMLPLQLLLSAPMLILTWGLVPLVAFYVVLLILDVILIATVKRSILVIVMLEWLIISPTFIYWAITYQYWLWVALVITFFITQFIRSRRINSRLEMSG